MGGKINRSVDCIFLPFCDHWGHPESVLKKGKRAPLETVLGRATRAVSVILLHIKHTQLKRFCYFLLFDVFYALRKCFLRIIFHLSA